MPGQPRLPSFILSPDAKTTATRAKAADFAQNYREHAKALYVWMHVQLQPGLSARLSADDLVQESWCRAYSAWARFAPDRAGFRYWLFGIARNVLREELRRLARSPAPLGQAAGPPSHAPAQVVAELTSISERAARTEEVQSLLELAAGLPEDERQLLLMRGLEELSYEDIGQHLGLTATAVRGRWRRLQERCRRTLRRFDVSFAGLRQEGG